MPEHYPEHTDHVLVIQTHHAWVFLTDKHAYKMKKPSQRGQLHFSSLESRHHLCAEEYRLNRRLARRTYLGLVPLVVGTDRRLKLGNEGTVVEWLVKMRRLPSEQLLVNAAAKGRASEDDIARLMRKLLRFYRNAAICSIGEISYPARLRNELSSVERELKKPRFRFPESLIGEIGDRQKSCFENCKEHLHRRSRDGHVREVHGDLRPEHICLMPNADPEIIDCLEFDPDLRCLDCVEELAFLGMECRVIGQRWIEEKIMAWYLHNSHDEVPMEVWHFYAARRATTRAMLCAWHSADVAGVNRWLERGREYLNLALGYLDAASTS